MGTAWIEVIALDTRTREASAVGTVDADGLARVEDACKDHIGGIDRAPNGSMLPKRDFCILSAFSGCSRDDIYAMSADDLREAVIRVFSLPCEEFSPGDPWYGVFMLPDAAAAAFRRRAV